MPSHIHLIENDWLAGQQRIVATLSFARGRYDLQSQDPVKWANSLRLGQLPELVRPEDEERLLNTIASRVQGDYLFCTEPHEADGCNFPEVSSLQSPRAPAHAIRRPAAAI